MGQIKRFFKDTKGSMALETMFALPVAASVVLGSFSAVEELLQSKVETIRAGFETVETPVE